MRQKKTLNKLIQIGLIIHIFGTLYLIRHLKLKIENLVWKLAVIKALELRILFKSVCLFTFLAWHIYSAILNFKKWWNLDFLNSKSASERSPKYQEWFFLFGGNDSVLKAMGQPNHVTKFL